MAKNFRNIPGQQSHPTKTARAQATFQQAYALHQKGQLTQAEALYKSLLKIQPQHFDGLYLFGCLAYQTNRHQMAVELISKAIEINPRVASTYSNVGIALQALRRLDEALLNYDKAIALKPDFAEAYNNRGTVLNELNRPDEALLCYDKAIALQPGYADAYSNRGNALKDLRRLDEALRSYDKAIALKPGHAVAYNSRGVALQDLKRLDEALASCDKAIAFHPGYAEAYNNRGAVLRGLKRLDEALASYSKAIALKPDYEFLRGTLLHAKMELCDWQGLSESLKSYEADIRASKKVTLPFSALSLLDSPEIHKQAAKVYTDTKYPKKEYPGGFKQHAQGEKIRVGYYSADFRNHAVTYLTAELFEVHSRDRFEIYGFSFGPDTNDEMRQRVSSAFDKFFDVRSMSDSEVIKLSRELGIDIAVDLGGYTENSRTGIFAARCAPVQVNYLGYPGTMGGDYIDYVIADKTVIPAESQPYFTEKIVYMPHTFQVNDSKREISERMFTKQELELPEAGFVFCCFNNNYKILPSTFDVWMRILKTVEGSVLWLIAGNPTAANNLRKEAELRGVDGSRLVFAQRMPYGDYLARYRWADLFLDTLPYNAGTTSSDALWAGLPVLTCKGKSFAGRMAASLLTAVELPELIASTEVEYEAKAVELASNSVKLSEIKRRLDSSRLITPLFDAKLFALQIESAYESMYDRHQAGLAPENIEVKACAASPGVLIAQ